MREESGDRRSSPALTISFYRNPGSSPSLLERIRLPPRWGEGLALLGTLWACAAPGQGSRSRGPSGTPKAAVRILVLGSLARSNPGLGENQPVLCRSQASISRTGKGSKYPLTLPCRDRRREGRRDLIQPQPHPQGPRSRVP